MKQSQILIEMLYRAYHFVIIIMSALTWICIDSATLRLTVSLPTTTIGYHML